MKQVLGLAILATLFTSPALAGETFVLNQWTIKGGRTQTNFNIDTVTNSNRTQDYSSSSDKIYIDGMVEAEYNNGKVGEYFKDFTVYNGGSELNGSFHEKMTTRVWGTINTIMNSYTSTHESSAGIR
ncbi:hypothetical protein NIES4072_49960 [Nostoc commune NIES-4072]|uniref:Uncharacterized protein n=1 Tax=Nostoc commune NIES-4072 TaxID=2005467 RepID=A0A2R5FRD3_NOSCO|nr:hypothetical protein [Nostoc commune]BBD67706.1 hypothetical protein NIES4070_40990 [Nostoc commune HK-02]GBG21312.1 hypothetical protein NIES4072_49960 [Nostoc commune NIES-4072]